MVHFIPHHHPPPPEIEAIMADFFQVEDMHDLELFRKLRAVTHLIGYLKGDYHKGTRLSASRMRLLIHLAIADQLNGVGGLLPSELSKYLRVSRNTVSALLKGLEEQKLVERHLHPTDHRQFLIRLTPAGEQAARVQAPQFATFVSELMSILTLEERLMLSQILDKLIGGLIERAENLGLSTNCPVSEDE